jgi:hypothetical protein
MAASRDIVATYRGPRRVFARLLSGDAREDRALIYLMAACLIFFVAQTPRLAREAHLAGVELNMLLGATMMAWLFIAPLLLYLIAGITHLLARIVGGRGRGYDARIALFWALLASSPIVLLHGLTAGFIGTGIELTLVGLVWLCVFLWFWLTGFYVAEWGRAV